VDNGMQQFERLCDLHRTQFHTAVETAYQYAAVPESNEVASLAQALLDELNHQAQADRGLTPHGFSHDGEGRCLIVLSGAVDLVALARRALLSVEARENKEAHLAKLRSDRESKRARAKAAIMR
jgi:hypothetical protein